MIGASLGGNAVANGYHDSYVHPSEPNYLWMASGENFGILDDDDPASKIVAYAAPGVVAHLKACKPRVCEVEAGDTDGWVDRRNIWGVGVDEVVQ